MNQWWICFNCSMHRIINVTHTFCIGKIGSISHRQKWRRNCRFEYLVLCVFSKGCIIIITNRGANEFFICIVMHPFAVVAHIRVVCTRLFADSSSYLFSFSIAGTYISKTNMVINIDRYVAHNSCSMIQILKNASTLIYCCWTGDLIWDCCLLEVALDCNSIRDFLLLSEIWNLFDFRLLCNYKLQVDRIRIMVHTEVFKF